jgi:DNA-binding transcriptional MerR regulator
MDQKSYTTPEMSMVLGVSQRNIFAYSAKGYITPSVQGASGPGSKRLWSEEDLLRCAALFQLSNGVNHGLLRAISEELRASDIAKLKKKSGLMIRMPLEKKYTYLRKTLLQELDSFIFVDEKSLHPDSIGRNLGSYIYLDLQAIRDSVKIGLRNIPYSSNERRRSQ